MYQFHRFTVGPFAVHESHPRPGDEHRKILAEGLTPENQATLNCYVSGSWSLTYADGTETLFSGGSCSLDAPLNDLPAGLCVEQCQVAGKRLCIEPIVRVVPWTRKSWIIPVGRSRDVPKSVVVALGGSIRIGEETIDSGGVVEVQDCVVTTDTGARILVLTALPAP